MRSSRTLPDCCRENTGCAGRCSLPTGTSRAARFPFPSVAPDSFHGPPSPNLRLPLSIIPWRDTHVSIAHDRRNRLSEFHFAVRESRIRCDQAFVPALDSPRRNRSRRHADILRSGEFAHPDAVRGDDARRGERREFRDRRCDRNYLRHCDRDSLRRTALAQLLGPPLSPRGDHRFFGDDQPRHGAPGIPRSAGGCHCSAPSSVCMLAAAGFVLSFAYVGSFKGAYGTSYGAMVSAKVVLFGLLLFLGALNYQLVRRGSASSIVSSLKRFGEAELGIGITVILTAASLTSLPPAADLTRDRVSRSEIFARMAPHPPRLGSPTLQELPEDVYAAQSKAFGAGSLTTESFVPGQAGTRPNTPAEKAWSEYNHHWAGIIVLSVGLLAFHAQASQISWARHWPLAFLGLAVFLFLRSDPEVWPLGPNGFWITLADPEVLMHRIFVLLVIALAVFEWRVQTGRVASCRARLIFPVLVAVSGALLLTHSHSLGNLKEEVLAELSHIPLAILAVTLGWSRWLELRLPAENQTRNALARLWPLCLALIGVVLLNYREM